MDRIKRVLRRNLFEFVSLSELWKVAPSLETCEHIHIKSYIGHENCIVEKMDLEPKNQSKSILKWIKLISNRLKILQKSNYYRKFA